LDESAAQKLSQISGCQETKSAPLQLTISSNGGVLPLKLPCEVNQLPPQFQRIEVSPDNSAIRQALEAGDIEAQKVAQFGERETHLRVL
jgi:hypothetical protein